jgi:hypothetical protein
MERRARRTQRGRGVSRRPSFWQRRWQGALVGDRPARHDLALASRPVSPGMATPIGAEGQEGALDGHRRADSRERAG